jgi:hypothetical protein
VGTSSKSKINRFAELLISKGAVCTPDAVMNAAYRCDVSLLRTLIERGGDPEARNDTGATPLIIASQFGDIETLTQLISWGVDINTTDTNGLSAAQWAIASEQFKALALLTTHGAEVPSEDDWTPTEYPSEAKAEDSQVQQHRLPDIVPPPIYESRLIHMSLAGVRVRSKSELLIADTLFHSGIPFEYETPYWGSALPSMKLPDFTFRCIKSRKIIIWEHLGLLSDKSYAQRWESKLKWYKANGLVVNKTLFITSDDTRGGFDSKAIYEIAMQIRQLL